MADAKTSLSLVTLRYSVPPPLLYVMPQGQYFYGRTENLGKAVRVVRGKHGYIRLGNLQGF